MPAVYRAWQLGIPDQLMASTQADELELDGLCDGNCHEAVFGRLELEKRLRGTGGPPRGLEGQGWCLACGVYGHMVATCPFQDEEEEPAQESKAGKEQEEKGERKLHLSIDMDHLRAVYRYLSTGEYPEKATKEKRGIEKESQYIRFERH
ncbi:hypothetical protein EOD39_13049 [Acipenser ruthenus]|uniref:CCHC-type domain-containing protein n=1 Tax=Acipenser ruthenus TaxID=7906 RepID=A0A662YRD2_ACIRT|nr:hypothetical protein EOD39_13049 [Acipenser ruthenus]